MVLGTNFYDKLVQAIQPGDKVVGLENVITIPILRSSPRTRRLLQQKKRRIPNDHEKNAKTWTYLILTSATIGILAQNQAWIPDYAKRHGFIVKRSESKLFDKHERIST